MKVRMDSLSVIPEKIPQKVGGLPSGSGIIEISGEAAVGKTQLCLQMALAVQLQTNSQSECIQVCYVCTEDRFPDNRMAQMQAALKEKTISNHFREKDLSVNVLVFDVKDVDGLKRCVKGTLPSLCAARRSVALVIIDSIAAPFRGEYEQHEMISRARDIQTIGYALHSLSAQYGCAVVCVNQVTACIDSRQDELTRELKPYPTATCMPALGLTWYNMVKTRIFLNRVEGREINGVPVRQIRIVFSTCLEKKDGFYVITKEGVKGVL